MKLLETQKYAECQLVAVINAAAFLGEPLVDPDSDEYERLVDLVGARHGSAISIRWAVQHLRLIRHDIEPLNASSLRCQVASGHPVQVNLQHPTLGNHAVLLTDDNGRSVRVWNLRRKGFAKDRLSWERLVEMIAAQSSHNRHAYWFELDPLTTKKSKPGTYRAPLNSQKG